MRSKKGIVTSNKQQKTLVVTVRTYKRHPKYKKRYQSSKKFYVDNPENKRFAMDDEIVIYETRPLSKLKRWTIVPPSQNSNKPTSI